MINWYYVVGSERVGPVSESALKVMFMNNQITLETYVWRKGFQNWERLKDVSELNFENQSAAVEETQAEEDDIQIEEMTFKTITKSTPVEKSSPEVDFVFDWKKVRQDEELFFIKIGKDRKNANGSDIYGPYSMVEIKEAIEQKRMNMQTLIFAAGMDSWTKIQDTILNPHSGSLHSGISLNEAPLMLVFDYSPLPLVTLVKKAGVKEGILLGAGPFSDFTLGTHKVSLYVGSELKAKNVTVKINSYDKIGQSMDCQFLDLNQDAKKIMLNHAV